MSHAIDAKLVDQSMQFQLMCTDDIAAALVTVCFRESFTGLLSLIETNWLLYIIHAYAHVRIPSKDQWSSARFLSLALCSCIKL